MLVALIALLVGVPILEIYVVIKVGQLIGVGPTILLMLLDAVLGSVLMRSQGRAVWRRFTETLAAGRVPAREVLDGVLVIFGGALLIAPGFVTDVLGALLLAPPTRALVRRLATRRLVARALRRSDAAYAGPRGARGYDVEGSAVEIEHGDALPR